MDRRSFFKLLGKGGAAIAAAPVLSALPAAAPAIASAPAPATVAMSGGALAAITALTISFERMAEEIRWMSPQFYEVEHAIGAGVPASISISMIGDPQVKIGDVLDDGWFKKFGPNLDKSMAQMPEGMKFIVQSFSCQAETGLPVVTKIEAIEVVFDDFSRFERT